MVWEDSAPRLLSIVDSKNNGGTKSFINENVYLCVVYKRFILWQY